MTPELKAQQARVGRLLGARDRLRAKPHSAAAMMKMNSSIVREKFKLEAMLRRSKATS